MKLYESAEDYLERILILKEKKGYVHAIDIAEDMQFSKASVSVAMKKLRENGLITVEKDGKIFLTKEGYRVASKTYEKHRIISHALMAMGVSEKQALTDACKIEHDLSDESFNAIKNYIENLKNKK